MSGVFTAVSETTERVIGERRLNCLRALANSRAGAESTAAVIDGAISVLDTVTWDVPFACIYGANEANQLGAGAFAGLDPAIDPSAWPLQAVMADRSPIEIDELPALPGLRLVSGRLPERALVLPVSGRSSDQLAAVLVCGLSPIRSLDEDYRSFLGLIADDLAAGLAAARAREEERRQADALAALDEAKTRFFSNVSHEFRTPLTLLLGPLDDLLSEAEPLTASQREALTLGRRNALRMRRLVNGLLDLSQAERGGLKANFESVDLPSYTSDLAGAFRSAIETAGLELRVRCEPIERPVLIDMSMWEKIVLNLLSNALKYTWQGTISVSLTADGGEIVLSVSDTGVGISAEEQPHLFERFHRAHGVQARSQEGSGIGLALVSELVRLHAGMVSVQSEPGNGSTFTVRLALRYAPEDEGGSLGAWPSAVAATEMFLADAERWEGIDDSSDSAPLGAPVAESSERARLLVVDDNADMRSYLVRLLEERFDVERVANGRLALAAIEDRQPDLILTDVMMPELDGLGLLRELRADPRTARVPVIVLTARAGQESSVDGFDAGADDYLVKPFSRIELLARIRASLRSSELREQAARQATRWAERLERLAEASARIVACLAPQEVKDTLADEVRTLLGAAAVTVIDFETAESEHPHDGQENPVVHVQPLEFPGSGVIGSMCIVSADGTELGVEDRALCAQLALVGAGALHRALLRSAERDTIKQLQESLLPQRLPTLPAYELAARYLAASSSAAVGGDWYDAIALPDGRTAFLVGDVVGHGIEAAATMSSLRNVLHAFLIEGDSPGEALARLHAIVDRTGVGLTATLCCMAIHLESGTGTVASAGHPPPLLVDGEGNARYLDLAGGQLPALGLGTAPAPSECALQLMEGETLILYTDGLIEPADHSDGFAVLPTAARAPDADLDTYCDRLIDTLVPTAARRDDIALLALRRHRPGEATLELRPTAANTAGYEVRRQLRPWLASQAFDGEASEDALLAVSEAVANSAEHSGISMHEQVSVRARLHGGMLTITVRDAGRWRQPSESTMRGHGLVLMRAIMDTVEIDRRDDGTRVELVRSPRIP